MNNPTQVTVAPKGMGLNDFVAQQEGILLCRRPGRFPRLEDFQRHPIELEGARLFRAPLRDEPYSEGRDVIQGACAWGSICNASAGMGRFVPQAYGDSPWAIFVRPDSSHSHTPGSERCAHCRGHARRQPLQRALQAGEISAAREYQGPEHRRLRGPAESIARRRSGSREPPATADRHGRAAWPAQDHRGSLPHLDGGFQNRPRPRLWARICAPSIVRRKRWRPIWRNAALWDLAVPPEFKDRNWDYSKFGRGERFVYKPIPRGEFDDVMNQVERWGLDQHLKERSFERLAADAR